MPPGSGIKEGVARTTGAVACRSSARRAARGQAMDVRGRLIVALDVPSVAEARALVQRLGEGANFYKVGLELVAAGGMAFARELVGAGKQVFLDLKLLDIGNTVERATRAAAETGATFLTVHAQDRKTIAAAVAGKEGTALKVLGVTVLTNLDAADIREQGIGEEPRALVERRAAIARAAGCDGVVASGQEARRVRKILGAEMVIVTPGVRLLGDRHGDQARVTTPQAALADGADHLVVGRPITGARDPEAALAAFISAIAAATAP
jgi:orotidine-5'-phosphate decarboxylase